MSPRSKEQFDEMRAKSRSAIMDSALELFTHKGYHGTSVSMIADGAGVSTGLMYNYFKSKLDLLKAIIDEGIEIIGMSMIEIEQISKPSKQLEAIIEKTFEIAKQDFHFWMMYFHIIMLPDLPDSVKGIFSEFMKSTFDMLETVFQKIGVTDPAAEARIFGAILDGVFLHYWLIKKDYPLEKVQKLFVEKYSSHGASK